MVMESMEEKRQKDQATVPQKKRNKKTLVIVGLVTLVTLLAGGLILVKTLQKPTETGRVSETGTVVFKGDGGKITVADQRELTGEETVIDLYLEQNSGSAVMVYDKLNADLTRLMQEKDVLVRYNPLVYLNNQVDAGSSYIVNKTALALAELSPETVKPYLDKVYTEGKALTEEGIKALLKGLALTDELITEVMGTGLDYHDHLVKGTDAFVVKETVSMPYIEVHQDGTTSVIDVTDINKVVENIKTLFVTEKVTE